MKKNYLLKMWEAEKLTPNGLIYTYELMVALYKSMKKTDKIDIIVKDNNGSRKIGDFIKKGCSLRGTSIYFDAEIDDREEYILNDSDVAILPTFDVDDSNIKDISEIKEDVGNGHFKIHPAGKIIVINIILIKYEE